MKKSKKCSPKSLFLIKISCIYLSMFDKDGYIYHFFLLLKSTYRMIETAIHMREERVENVSKYNRVFGYVWLPESMQALLDRACAKPIT